MVADFNDARDAGSDEEPEESARAFLEMLNSSQQPLHDYTDQCQLDAIGQAMSMKTQFNMSRDNFDSMMTSWGRSLPEGHKLPKSWYEAKKTLRALKMPYEQIHACPNGCVLFTKEYADDKYCVKCGSYRYTERVLPDGTKKHTKFPANVLRYLPILPRLQRLYLNEDTTLQMVWHKYGIRRDKDDHGRPMLIHPSCAQAWKNFDRLHPEKAKEARNPRVAIGLDGFNPFGFVSKTYSCWHVFVVPLNLPPGVLMQRKHIFLSLIIPGPKYPGKNINVYLQPLIDELKEAWVNGIQTYDAASKKNFNMHVWYLYSMHDLPAFSLFMG